MHYCSKHLSPTVDQPPVFQMCPGDLVFHTDSDTTQVSWNAPTITDDNQFDSDDVEVVIHPPLDPPFDPLEDPTLTLDIGVYTVGYTYTDVHRREAECSFTVTVKGVDQGYN